MEIQKKMTGGLDFRCEVKGCRYRNGSAGQTDQRVTTRGSPRSTEPKKWPRAITLLLRTLGYELFSLSRISRSLLRIPQYQEHC